MAEFSHKSKTEVIDMANVPTKIDNPNNPASNQHKPTSLRFPDLRHNDVQTDEICDELRDLMLGRGFDTSIEIKYLAEGRTCLTLDLEVRNDLAGSRNDPLKSSGTHLEDESTGSDRLEIGPMATRRTRSFRVREASFFSYTSGLLGAAAFMALAIGPGWLGFIAVFLPASLLASWAVSGHA